MIEKEGLWSRLHKTYLHSILTRLKFRSKKPEKELRIFPSQQQELSAEHGEEVHSSLEELSLENNKSIVKIQHTMCAQHEEKPIFHGLYATFSKEDFRVTNILGIGAQGTIYEADHNNFGSVAVKLHRRSGIRGELRELMNKREIVHTLENSSHPNIVPCFGVVLQTSTNAPVGFVMQLMENGSVYNVLRGSKASTDNATKLSWIYQSGKALSFLHSRKLAHRDVKPANMLLCNSFQILKLADFGLMVNPHQIEDDLNQERDINVGTIPYIAPDQWSKPRIEGFCSGDIYSLAISAWEIMTNSLLDDQTTKVQHLRCHYFENLRPRASAITDKEIRSYLVKSWSPDPRKRPSATEFTLFFNEKWRQALTRHKETRRSISDASDKRRKYHNGKPRNISLGLPERVQSFSFKEFYGSDQIGSGGFGTVWRSHHSQFGDVAVKSFSHSWSYNQEREIVHMMKDSHHTNIVRFYGVLLQPDSQIPIGYVMELCDKSLKEALHENQKPINTDLKYDWICQAGRALDYLHSKRLAHRDIKPDNMLLFNNFQALRICDLGMTRHCDGRDSFSDKLMGTHIYSAPEVTLEKADRYNIEVDIYSFAITIWEIVTRREPFDHITEENSSVELVWKIAKQDERPEKSDAFDLETWTLLEKSWAKQSSKRPAATEIVEFFSEKLNKEEQEENENEEC